MPVPNGPWLIQSTRSVYKDGFIEVGEDNVTRPGGQEGHYATVRMKPGVSVLPVHDDGKVILIRQFRYAIRRERIECVCGGIDGNETAEQTALRELREEAGLIARLLIPVGSVEMDGSIILNRNQLFIARELTVTSANRESTEQIVVVTMPLTEAVQKVLSGEIDHAPTCVLLLKASLQLQQELP